jgi:cysteine desulfurase family protein (TIGR01976 family)
MLVAIGPDVGHTRTGEAMTTASTSVNEHRDVRSVTEIRTDFPALARHQDGRPVAFFDAPGGTQVPRVVIDAVAAYLARHNANTHWAYPTSEETDAILAHARERMAMFLNAAPDEIAFGPNMTTLTYHLSRALGRRWGAGDTVVVTDLDHHANIDPWRALEAERGITVRRVPFDVSTGTLDWPALVRALDAGVVLLAIGAASNALGTITDVRAAARLAHAAGALVFVDAVAYAPHVLVDVGALECDFLACSPYKFYGPHIGVLHGKRDVLALLDVPKLEPAPDGPAERFETGTQNHEGIAGAAAAVAYLASLAPGPQGRAALQAAYAVLDRRAQTLVERAWRAMERMDRVRLYGPPPETRRTPTIAFTVRGRSADAVARSLARAGVFVSHGDFYAVTVVRRLGLAPDGLVRAGCACYTSEEDIDRLLEAVESL